MPTNWFVHALDIEGALQIRCEVIHDRGPFRWNFHGLLISNLSQAIGLQILVILEHVDQNVPQPQCS